MQITHLGHSAVLVETDNARILIDPGNFSDAWHSVTALDAVLPSLGNAAEALPADRQEAVGDVLITAVGGQHAVIHRDLSRIGKVGYLVSSEGQPTLFHPGDAVDIAPPAVDIVAVPAYGPWAAMKETVDFVRAVGALEGFPIHDGLLNERGFGVVFKRVGEMTGTRLVDLRGGAAHQF